MVKHTQTIRQQEVTNCLSMFNQFVGRALKGLMAIEQDECSLESKGIYASLRIRFLEN